MSTNTTEPSGEPAAALGINGWLVEEMYEKFLADRESVEKSWWPVLEAYAPGDGASPGPEATPPIAATAAPADRLPSDRPAPAAPPVPAETRPEDTTAPLRGTAKSLARNMDASLAMPTATSVRSVAANLMAENRAIINDHLRRTRGGKVSFTHLVAWAIVRSLEEFPGQNVSYTLADGKPSVPRTPTSTSASRSTSRSPAASARWSFRRSGMPRR